MSNPVKGVSEKDKPFVLAIVAAGITATNIVIAGVGALLHNPEMMNEAIDTLKYTFPLTVTAWAFYFKSNSTPS
jgi:hypothetical protein